MEPDTGRVVVRHPHGPHGELVLRQSADDNFEIISNGVFLMDTRNGESERLLVSAALDCLPGSQLDVLVGGLGMGFSLVEALASPRVTTVTVVERLSEIIDWHHNRLRGVSRGAVDDPRTLMIHDDLVAWLHTTNQQFDAIWLDIDNGPHWTIVPDNDRLYGEEATARLAEVVRPGGVVTVWGAEDSPAYRQRLAWRFAEVTTVKVEVPRGEPDVVFLAKGPLGRYRPASCSRPRKALVGVADVQIGPSPTRPPDTPAPGTRHTGIGVIGKKTYLCARQGGREASASALATSPTQPTCK